MSDIDLEKENAFNKISEILLSIGTNNPDDLEKTTHILDILEQLLARAIAGSSLSNENIDELCEESFHYIKKMAKHFLREELNQVVQ